MLLLGAVALPGCGSVQEVIVDAVRSSAKESIDQAVDEAVDELVDEVLDFDGLTVDDGQPNE
jgi:flavin-binding protein dodecin